MRAPRRDRPDEVCAAIAAAQHGILTRAQALAAGMAPARIAHRLRSRRWEKVLGRVYGIAGVPQSPERDVMALALWAGSHAAASHRCAAALLGLDGFRIAPPEISTVRPLNAPRAGWVVHRVNRFLIGEIGAIGGIPTTSVRRTLLDLTGVRDPRSEAALDHALRTGMTTLGQMWLLYEEEWTRGRRGIAILRGRLAERSPALIPTDSELEDLMARVLRNANLPEPERQFPIQLSSHLAHVDLAYPDARVAIECDGYAWHMDRGAFERDRRRDVELQGMGWKVLRFTWARLRWEPAEVAAQIRLHLVSSAERVPARA